MPGLPVPSLVLVVARVVPVVPGIENGRGYGYDQHEEDAGKNGPQGVPRRRVGGGKHQREVSAWLEVAGYNSRRAGAFGAQLGHEAPVEDIEGVAVVVHGTLKAA